MISIKNALITAAVSGMSVGVVACGGSATPAATSGGTTAEPAKHACKGMNACKSQGGCKTETHACKGQNDCKGQGGCKG
jgi:hypothetical protein